MIASKTNILEAEAKVQKYADESMLFVQADMAAQIGLKFKSLCVVFLAAASILNGCTTFESHYVPIEKKTYTRVLYRSPNGGATVRQVDGPNGRRYVTQHKYSRRTK